MGGCREDMGCVEGEGGEKRNCQGGEGKFLGRWGRSEMGGFSWV